MDNNLNEKKSSKKKWGVVLIIFVFVLVLGISFAAVLRTLRGTKNLVLVSSDLQLYLDEENNLSDVIQGTVTIPVEDFEGKRTEPYKFSLVNQGSAFVRYTVYLVDNPENTMPIYALRYYLSGQNGEANNIGNIEDLEVIDGRRKLYTSYIPKKTTQDFELRIFLGVQAENDAKNKTYSVKIEVDATQSTNNYYDEVLNGCDPVLTTNLVPVTIESNGTVKKANLKDVWYDYSKQEWANAVVLEDNAKTYQDGETIASTDIESYFVWIPRYKYKIFNDGNYTDVTAISDTAPQTIEIEFETKDKAPSNGTAKDEWLSHPAFQAFDTNGFWVGKFETGYKGATTTEEAQVDSSDSSKIVVKPNIFSWRNITVGNAFKASYDYLRSNESHMMKNTEWGAVAYLQHSIYGSRASVRVNNNSSYKTGYAAVVEPTLGYSTSSISGNLYGTAESVTLPYNTTTGYTASTTANITGVYDMSGGAHEYVMGYNQNANSVGGSSGLTGIYGDFFSNSEWDKYYDKYTNSANSETAYQNRLLGDATGEMGPFGNVKDPDGQTRHRTSWYGDYAFFTTSTSPWFYRGGIWNGGVGVGVFYFNGSAGGTDASISFRLVLAP